MNYPLVSVVILNYNGKTYLGETLLKCLSSVLKNAYSNFEVIFVDNGSTDDSIEFIKEVFRGNPKLKIVKNEKNYGFALGNNLGVKHAKGKYVILLNNDIEVEPRWMKELVKVMEADLNIGVAQSKVLYMDRLHIQTVGNLLDPAQLTYLMGYNQEDKGQYNKVCEITFACGAAFIVRRALINEIGLFDPKYFSYHDDCDLGWRARLAGYKVVVVPSSVVYHYGGGTYTQRAHAKNLDFFFLLASRFGLFIKNYEYKNILKFGTIMVVSIVMDVLVLLWRGDIGTPLKFMVWILRDFRHNWKKRLETQLQIRKVADDEILKAFLDSSILILRLTRHLDRVLGGRLHRHFDGLVGKIIDNYYLNHIYKK